MRRSVLALLVLSACGPTFPKSEVPSSPGLTIGRATVNGRVFDANGLAVGSVLVWSAESDDSTTSAADGTFTLSVPADTTVTLRALKEVFTGTSMQPFSLRPGDVFDGLEVMMIPGSTLGLLNTLARGLEDHGAVAVTVTSLGSCDPTNGKLRLALVPTAKALYVRSGQRAPDVALEGMRLGGRPNAWIAGVPAGTGYELIFEKTGCRQVSLPVSNGGADWQPGLRVTRGLTVANVFVE
jgi:hypothetical protein